MDYTFTPVAAGLATSDLDDDVDEDFSSIKKQLFNCDTPAVKKEAVQVFLRVRPRSTLEIQLKQPECFHFPNSQELIAIAPKSSQSYKSKTATHNNSKYSFTKIFGPNTTQVDLFEETLLPSLKDFLEGQNCLVFTYGVTNSGKTHTVSGTPSNPGLLPRMLDVVFNSVQDGRLLTDVKFKPKHFSGVSYPSQKELAYESEIKAAILAKAMEVDQTLSTFPVLDETGSEQDISSVSSVSSKVSSNISKLSSDAGMSFEIPTQDSSTIDLDDNSCYYSVWVSYAEIYNEFIYDLLGDAHVTGKTRSALKLQDDKNHNQFIRDLREIQVSTVEEAMLLLRWGLRHRSQAATRLNYSSSRSHAVYTVKLIKVVNPDKPANALVNRVSIVDLAGAERSSKTGASGARVKEAGQINKSLLTLGKCIDAMKHNQLKKGDDLVVPFRESKLTRLFQSYFVGKGGKEARQGKVTMFVNISNVASVFDETMHVLRFSALTSKVIPLVKSLPGPTPQKRSKTSNLPLPTPSTLTRSHLPLPTPSTLKCSQIRPAMPTYSSEEDCSSSTDVGPAQCLNCKSMSEMVGSLRSELREQEYKIRQEVCKEFNEQLIEIEDNHSRELEMQAEEIEEAYEQRMNNLQKSMKKQFSRKRRRRDDDEEEGNGDQRLREMVEQLEERNRELEEDLELERERAAAEIRDTVESHETRVVSLNRQLADKCVEALERGKEMAELKEQLSSLQGELVQLRGQEGQLADKCAEALERGKEIAELKEQLSSFQGELGQLRGQEGQLADKCAEALERGKEIAELKEQLSSLQGELGQLRGLEGPLADKCAEALERGKEIAELKEQLSSFQGELGQLRGQEGQLVPQLEALKNKLSSAETSAEYALAEVEILTSRISELTSENEGMEAVKNEMEEQLKEATTSTAPTDDSERVVSLESQLAELNSQLITTQAELSSITSRHEEETKSWEAQAAEYNIEKEAWQLDRTTLTQAHTEKVEVELLRVRGAYDEDKASELESLRSAHTSEKASWEERMESVAETHLNEKAALQTELSRLGQEKDLLSSELDDFKKSHSSTMDELQGVLDGEVVSLKREHLKEKAAWENQVEALKNEMNSVSAKVAVKNEKIYKVESEKENLERVLDDLKQMLEGKEGMISELTNQTNSLSSSIKKTFKDYETTLKNQTTHIEELKRENEVAVAQNEELTQQCSDLELRMSRACAAKEAMSSRVEELTNSLDDSRRALSQRESELLDSSDQCRAMLEETISDLRKNNATLEHQLTIARDDTKTLQATFTEKESELLSLAKSVGGERAEMESLNSQILELTRRHQTQEEEHQTLVSEIKGTHQLVVAQYSIRVRELSDELESTRAELDAKRTELDSKKAELDNVGSSYESEVESVRAGWNDEVHGLNKKLQRAEKTLNKLAVMEAELKSFKKSSQQLKKEAEKDRKEINSLENTVGSLENTLCARDQELLKLKINHETAMQAVKDEWRTEVGEVRAAAQLPIYEELPEAPSEQPTIYDSVCDGSVNNEGPPSSNHTSVASVPKPVESTVNSRRSYLVAVTTSTAPDIERSFLPTVPILESSSQLMDDTGLSEPQRVEIDATPLPLRKKRRRFASKKTTDKENAVLSPPPEKKSKYTLRSRVKKVKEEDSTSLDGFTPTSQKSFRKKLSTKKNKVILPVTPMKEPVSLNTSTVSTRTRRGGLLKSQISGPIECFNSPMNMTRPRQQALMSGKGINLGKQLRPTTLVVHDC